VPILSEGEQWGIFLQNLKFSKPCRLSQYSQVLRRVDCYYVHTSVRRIILPLSWVQSSIVIQSNLEYGSIISSDTLVPMHQPKGLVSHPRQQETCRTASRYPTLDIPFLFVSYTGNMQPFVNLCRVKEGKFLVYSVICL
jgi:hypothetical protein